MKKKNKIDPFLKDFNDINYFVDYFDQFRVNLSKNTLNSFLKSVSTQ